MKVRQCDRCGKTMKDTHEGYRWVVDYLNGERLFFDTCEDCYAKFINEFMIIESEDKE